MRCEDVRELAGAWLDSELPEAQSRLVADHQARCPDCHGLIAELRRVSTGVALYAGAPAPVGLENRIRRMLAEEDGPRRAVRRGFIHQAAALAAVCVLSVIGTWAVMRQPEAPSMARHDVVAAHVRSLLQDSPIQVASGDSHTVRPWFNGRVEFAPPVKDLAAEGFQLLGGRLDVADGRRVATLVYKRRLHTISVFVWPAGAGPSAAAQVSGLNVLSWSKDGLTWWAVSDLNPDELRELRTLL